MRNVRCLAWLHCGCSRAGEQSGRERDGRAKRITTSVLAATIPGDSLSALVPMAAAPTALGFAVHDEGWARDCRNVWLRSRVVAERGEDNTRELLVYFFGWNKRFDEWKKPLQLRLEEPVRGG